MEFELRIHSEDACIELQPQLPLKGLFLSVPGRRCSSERHQSGGMIGWGPPGWIPDF